jgi:hypothetical protein
MKPPYPKSWFLTQYMEPIGGRDKKILSLILISEIRKIMAVACSHSAIAGEAECSSR